MSEELPVTVAVHERRIGDLEAEQQRHRERLHVLENERAALKLLAQRVDDMASAAKSTTETLNHVSEDVKQLLVSSAQTTATSAYRQRLWILAAGVLAAGWWLPDLVAHFTH